MQVVICFKDSVNKPSVTIENLTDIYGKSSDIKKREKHYTAENFHVFAPFDEESYSFVSRNGSVSVNGNEILYVQFSQ